MKNRLLELVNRLLRPAGLMLQRLPASPTQPLIGTMETEFLGWLAARKNLPPERARADYLAAAGRFDGGFGGAAFRRFLADLQDTAEIYYRCDSEADLRAAYQAHGLMHLLRMITYPMPTFESDAHLAETVKGKQCLAILDYGSGVGRYGIGLGLALRARGIGAVLYFLDVETIRFDFIEYVCRRHGLVYHFIPVTSGEGLYPALPPHDICVAIEVFEHMHRPLMALNNIHRSLAPGGLLYTNLTDHRAASMHVTLDLGPLPAQLAEWEYRELRPFRLYRKPAQASR